MQLDIDKALMAIQKLATDINSSATDAALGIIKVVNANMEQAIRTISLERGHDPRDLPLYLLEERALFTHANYLLKWGFPKYLYRLTQECYQH